MMGLGRSTQRNAHNKRSLIRPLTYITDVVQPEEANRWKSINTHTHTHTHTHANSSNNNKKNFIP